MHGFDVNNPINPQITQITQIANERAVRHL
jgi:hypothetical protein